MVASVPDDTRRTFSMLGSRPTMRWAMVSSISVGAPNDRPSAAVSCTTLTTSGSAWPRIIGPQEPT